MKPRMKMVFYTGIEKNSNYLLNILHHIFIMTDMQHCNSIGINFLNKLLCFIYNKIKCQCFHETMQRLYTSWWFHLLCLRDIFHFTNHNRKHPPPPLSRHTANINRHQPWCRLQVLGNSLFCFVFSLVLIFIYFFLS